MKMLDIPAKPGRRDWSDVLILAGLSAALAVCLSYLSSPPTHAQAPRIRDFACGADNIGNTLTILSAQDPVTGAVSGNCAAVEDGSVRYITDIVTQSTTTTGGQFILRVGTGSACATGTATIFPFTASTNVRLASPANTSPAGIITLKTPVRVPEGKDLCVLGVATNTTTIEVRGYIGPK